MKMIGKTGQSQMNNVFKQLFKMIFGSSFKVWRYTFRPNTNRLPDTGFLELPDGVVNSLLSFGLDTLGCYLPLDLLNGPIDESHPFCSDIIIGNDSDLLSEISRRRLAFDQLRDVVLRGINNGLSILRLHHYDFHENRLIACAARKNCKIHLTWKDFRVFCVQTGSDHLVTYEEVKKFFKELPKIQAAQTTGTSSE